MKKVSLIFDLFLLTFCLPNYAAKWRADHVIMIGIDGWGAYMQKFPILNL